MDSLISDRPTFPVAAAVCEAAAHLWPAEVEDLARRDAGERGGPMAAAPRSVEVGWKWRNGWPERPTDASRGRSEWFETRRIR